MGILSSLNIGLRSMNAQRTALEITGHNISNINTPGYSRKRVVMAYPEPMTMTTPFGAYQMGTGVEIATIERVHDDFLEIQIQNETQDFSNYEALSENYRIIEAAFNEPSDDSISSSLDEFWNAWQNVAAPSPADSAFRNDLRIKSTSLIDSMQFTYNRLQDHQDYLDTTITHTLTELNGIAKRIAGINGQLADVSSGVEPINLLDERDQVLLDLSRITNFTAIIQDDHTVDISIGGSPIVTNTETYQYTPYPNPTTRYNDIRDGNNEIVTGKFKSGKLAGLINLRDNVIDDLKSQMDDMTANLITEVNNLHNQGYDLYGNTNTDFFKGNSVQTIDLNTAITTDVNNIAASSKSDNLVGNGEIAFQIARIRDVAIMDNNTYTITDFYQSTISQLANDSGYASNLYKNQDTLLNTMVAQKASVSGVSMDEELTNMMKYEQAYEAAAKYIGVVNSILDTLFNMV